MRRRHKNHRTDFRRVLLHMLSIASHVAAIVGTTAAVIDLVHHW
jgi:hypothetical protein